MDKNEQKYIDQMARRDAKEHGLILKDNDYTGLSELWHETRETWKNLASRQKVGAVAGFMAVGLGFGLIGKSERESEKSTNDYYKNIEGIVDEDPSFPGSESLADSIKRNTEGQDVKFDIDDARKIEMTPEGEVVEVEPTEAKP